MTHRFLPAMLASCPRGLGAALLLACLCAMPAQASVTLEGDAGALVVVAEQASRREVVAALAEKFALKTVGMTVEDSLVSGRFTGTLGQVLKSILPRNGYAIAYRDGLPVRVTFSANGSGTSFTDPAMSTFLPVDPAPPPMAAVPTQPATSYMESQAQAAMASAPGAQTAPPPNAQPPGPPPAPGSEEMQRQIAESTARALQQLKQLTNDLDKVGP